jgi:soluble lytic murein transglycosylase
MQARTRALTLAWLFAFALAALGTGEAVSASHHKGRLAHRSKEATAAGHKHRTARNVKRDAAPSHGEESHEAATLLPPDLDAAKQAITLIRKSKWKDAGTLAASISDPVAQKLIEWALLRNPDSPATFERYAAFLAANPDWPSAQLRRSADARLWQERRDGTTVRRFVGNEPVSSVGRLTLARVLMNEGDRDGSAREVRAVWQSSELSAEMESAVLDTFTNMLNPADHVARMDRRLGAKDFGAAMRAAKRAGDDRVAIVKACVAAEAKSARGEALLDAVSTEAGTDLGYMLCRLHWLMRNDTPGSNLHGRIVTPKEDVAAAVKLVLAASTGDLQRQDTDEWWRERRALARKLIDLDDAGTAYQVVSQSAPSANP